MRRALICTEISNQDNEPPRLPAHTEVVVTGRKLLELSRTCAMPTHPWCHIQLGRICTLSVVFCLPLSSLLASTHIMFGFLRNTEGFFFLFVCFCYFAYLSLFCCGGSFPRLIFGLSLKLYAFSAFIFSEVGG